MITEDDKKRAAEAAKNTPIAIEGEVYKILCDEESRVLNQERIAREYKDRFKYRKDVMTAAGRGDQIEWCDSSDNVWRHKHPSARWRWDQLEYRVAPTQYIKYINIYTDGPADIWYSTKESADCDIDTRRQHLGVIEIKWNGEEFKATNV